MAETTTDVLVRIAFFARAFFALQRSPKMRRSYFTPAQWTRMWTLAERLDAAAIARFWLIQAAVLFLVSVVGGTVIFVVLVLSLPLAALRMETMFFAAVVLIVITGLLISRLFRLLWASGAMRARLTAEPGDAELMLRFSRMMRQSNRAAYGMTAIIAILWLLLFPPNSPIYLAFQWLLPAIWIFFAIWFVRFVARMMRWPQTVTRPQP